MLSDMQQQVASEAGKPLAVTPAAGRSKKINLGSLGLIFFFIVEIAIFSILSPYFLTVDNVFNIGRSICIVAIVAAGMAIALIGGGLDLSVGSVMAAASMVTASSLKVGMWYPLALTAGLLTGVAAGIVNGLIITRFRINPIIATLGTMGIIRGFAFIASKGSIITPVNAGWSYLGRGQILGIPVPIFLVAGVYLIAWIVMKYTRFGRYIYAIGGNPIACRLAGINVDNWQLLMYMICGTLAAFGGLVLGSLAGSAFPNAASGMELDIVAAPILGGVSMSGGVGSVGGALLGVLIIGILTNGLIQLNVPTYWQMVAKGLVLLVAVASDQLRSSKN